MNFTQEQKRLLSIALKAQAIGDAAGEDFEFLSEPLKVDLHDLINTDSYGLNITDDTQMTMFGLEGMINGGSLDDIKEQYIHWLNTQSQSATREFPISDKLIDQKKMWTIRAPGGTCLQSLRMLRKGLTVVNQSNGCGSVMKALPFLFAPTADLLVDVSLMTHHGSQIEPTAIHQWEYAQQLLAKNIPGKHIGLTLRSIYGDGGWQAGSCLAIAIWAFENCEGDFTKLLELAILHGGDSDSVAATAGAFYGLYYETYPEALYQRVFQHDVIDMLLGKLSVDNK